MIFNDSPLAKIITGFMNVFLFGCSSLFNGEKFYVVLEYLVVCLVCLASELGLYLLVAF